MEHSLRIVQVDLNHVSRNIREGKSFSFNYAPGVVSLLNLDHKSHSDVSRPAQIRRVLSLPQVVKYFGLKAEGRHVLGVDIYSLGTRTAHRTRVHLLGPSEQIRSLKDFPTGNKNRVYVGPVDVDFGVAPEGKVGCWAAHKLSRGANPVVFPIAEKDIVMNMNGDVLSRPLSQANKGRPLALSL